MPDLSNISDEDLLQEWNRTKAVAASLRPGIEPPRYTTVQYRRHMAAEAEIKRRSFIERLAGWWERPHID